jgi:hypothetical protein
MAPPRYLHRSVPAWVRALLAVLTLCAAAYAVLLVGGGEAVGVDPDSWWPLGALALGAGFACFARAAIRRSERVVWALLGVGMVSSGSGYLAWALLYEHQASPPYPSVADALWIPYFVLLLARWWPS